MQLPNKDYFHDYLETPPIYALNTHLGFEQYSLESCVLLTKLTDHVKFVDVIQLSS